MALALTTLDLVKAKDPDLAGGLVDEAIEALIAEVSSDAEERMCRWTLSTERRTELFELEPHRDRLWLPGFPITSTTSVRYGPTDDFSQITPLVSGQDYIVLKDTGMLILRSITTWYEPGFLQVVSTGGMAATTDEFVEKFGRLAGAVANEVVNRFNRRSTPDGSSTQNDAGAVTYQKELKPLEEFVAACARHKRRVNL